MTPTEQTVFISLAVVWGSLAFLAGVFRTMWKMAARAAERERAAEAANAEQARLEQIVP